jgi:hypothetical protein
MLHAYTRERTPAKPDSLRDLVIPENVIPWIDHMQNEKHHFRNTVWATVGPLHAIVSKHSLFDGMDFKFILDRIGKVPVERGYKRTERKEEDAVSYEALKATPNQLIAQSERPGLNIYQVARLRRNAAIASLLLLALRQRNVRSCDLRVNFVKKRITNKMAHDHDVDMPNCVRAAWENDKQREFHMLVYDEAATKAGRAEIVILPLATATIIDEYKRNYRDHLISNKHKKDDKGYLFPSKSGEALAKSSMSCIVRYFTRSTVGTDVHPHLWRSIFDSHVMHLAAIGIGKGLQYAQRCSWQVDEKTTAKYTDLEFVAGGIAALDRYFTTPYAAVE